MLRLFVSYLLYSLLNIEMKAVFSLLMNYTVKCNPQRDDSRTRGAADDKARLLDRSPRTNNRAMRIFLYQIRCNLFHGNKLFGDSNNYEIAKNVSELLLRYNLIFTKQL